MQVEPLQALAIAMFAGFGLSIGNKLMEYGLLHFNQWLYREQIALEAQERKARELEHHRMHRENIEHSLRQAKRIFESEETKDQKRDC